jgi:hypothetical protein
MSAITYTALRNIEKTGYLKTGVDISAAASDDSFNSSTTTLSGLVLDNWIFVSGFSNAINNGWFHISGSSTTLKILQDTTTSLVNESAGPSISITGYKRGFGQSYSFEKGVTQATRSVNTIRSDKQPLGGGAPEVIFQREEVFYDVMTSTIQESELGQWREFLSSVQGGETFTFDRYGTVASPVEPKTAMLASTNYTENREGSSFVYTIGFKLRIFD